MNKCLCGNEARSDSNLCDVCFEISNAASADEAFEIFKKHNPDWVRKNLSK